MKKLLIIVTALFLASCASKRNVVYFQDINEGLMSIDSISQKTNIIEPKDILQIRITALEGRSVLPFMFENTMLSDPSVVRSGNDGRAERAKLNGYLVDPSGYINFPQLGKLKVMGKTTQEIETYIESLLKEYIKDPTVSVRLVNFKVAVLGQVRSPQVVYSDENSMTLPEALGMAGDLSIDGRRDNVLLIRQQGDTRIFKRLDMTQSDWINSPYYNLKQDDIVYVEPNRKAVKQAGDVASLSALLSVLSAMISIVTVLILK